MYEINRIETERLTLRKMTMNDIEDYCEWKSQDEYYQFLPGTPKDRDGQIASLKSSVEGYDSKEKPTLIWGVYLQNKLIGSVNISTISSRHKICEIGWGLNPKYHKQGYAYESVRAFINYIFDQYNMNRISIVIWDGNNASKKLAQKLGFVQEGIQRQARVKNDKVFDLYCYGLLREEWKL